MSQIIASAAVIAAVIFAQTYVSAQEGDSVGTQSARMSQRVMSPFCPGMTLYDCPSSSATEWRMDMARWIAEGESEAVILQRLQARVPSFSLTPPSPTPWLFGFVWLFATLVLALGIRRLVLRLRAAEIPSADESGDAESDRYDEQLDEALRLSAAD